jgi:hypothetical protein
MHDIAPTQNPARRFHTGRGFGSIALRLVILIYSAATFTMRKASERAAKLMV